MYCTSLEDANSYLCQDLSMGQTVVLLPVSQSEEQAVSFKSLGIATGRPDSHNPFIFTYYTSVCIQVTHNWQLSSVAPSELC